MKATRQYLIIDTKKYRRHSAPENLSSCFITKGKQSLSGRIDQCRASVSDFSILLENQSESGSSLELDTSNLSRDLSPDGTTKTTPTDSYQALPTTDIRGSGRDASEDDHCRGFYSWAMWKNILLSQAIAGCMAYMDLSNASLERNSRNFAGNGQNLPHYILLGVLWTSKLALRNDGRDIIHVIKFSGLRYLFLSALHVETNYLLVSSFQHSTYLGNQMMDCVAAALCLMITYVCLEVQFHLVHASGFTISVVGSACLCMANVIYRKKNYDDVLLGDTLRIICGTCLAFNSIAQEIIVKSIDFVEYMGMIGLMGSIICGLQAMTLETAEVIPRNTSYWLNLLSYSGTQFLFDSLTPKVLHEMGATGLHLALTTSAFYSYAVDVFYQRDKWDYLFLMSYGIIMAGSILFFSKKTVIGKESFFPVKIILIKET